MASGGKRLDRKAFYSFLLDQGLLLPADSASPIAANARPTLFFMADR